MTYPRCLKVVILLNSGLYCGAILIITICREVLLASGRAEVRDAARHFTMPRIVPYNKELPRPKYQ